MAKKKVNKKAHKKAPKRARSGRPTKFKKIFVEQAKQAARNAMADKQIADILGVSPAIIVKWKIEHPEFGEAIREGREELELGNVELSLRQQALPHDEVTQRFELKGRKTKKNPQGRKLTMVGKSVKKNVANVHAAEKILKAEMPKKYGDKVELSVPKPVKVDPELIKACRDAGKAFAEAMRGKQE